MSLTIGEATHINTVLEYWLDIPSEDGMPGRPTDKAVFAAMIELADRANARLGAGVHGAQVRKAWANRQRF